MIIKLIDFSKSIYDEKYLGPDEDLLRSLSNMIKILDNIISEKDKINFDGFKDW
jgi:hypothetical protein